jgi:hypothetical protein
MSNQTPFEWWEYDTASTQVLPLVVGPEIPDIPVSDVERCEMSAVEALANMIADHPDELTKEQLAEAYNRYLTTHVIRSGGRGKARREREIDWDAVVEKLYPEIRSKAERPTEFVILEPLARPGTERPRLPPGTGDVVEDWKRGSAARILLLLLYMIFFGLLILAGLFVFG